MSIDTRYDEYKQMPLDKLASIASGSGTGSGLEMAKIVYQQRITEDQQKFNRRTILFSVIISAILGMLGIISGALLQYYLERTRKRSNIQQTPSTCIIKEVIKPPKEPDDASTTKGTSS